ncbi:MAG TPA: 50S ribosomal protein L11 methyltransferase [Bacteroidales bacterium]|nr:50S ribosomal protein L11 methyltransferase [Bacteroidales bacterium]HSA43792.1 50S ribosomal protein L11 methyltransferase [Bacteroidales bacterium]
MRLLQFIFRFTDEANPDLLTAYLFTQGFSSFEEQEGRLLAYPDEAVRPDAVRKALHQRFGSAVTLEAVHELKDRNWNEEWEKHYSSVLIAGKICVRAPFHPAADPHLIEIVVEPKMSFGTAHHETTSQVMELMLDIDFRGRRVLDMGCGTAILAILAVKLGADGVLAIDNDRWAYENALENAERNGLAGQVRVIQADAGGIPDEQYHIILANINRNILMADMNSYAAHLLSGGLLVLSGFYEDDLPAIEAGCSRLNLARIRYLERNRWVAAVFQASSQAQK